MGGVFPFWVEKNKSVVYFVEVHVDFKNWKDCLELCTVNLYRKLNFPLDDLWRSAQFVLKSD